MPLSLMPWSESLSTLFARCVLSTETLPEGSRHCNLNIIPYATGFSPTGDRIVELAIQDTASLLEYSTLVSCAPGKVHLRAYQTHGISTKQSHENGLPFK